VYAVMLRALAVASACVLLALPAAAEVRIVLLPVAVHAQGEETEYLSAGLSSMLAARLEQYEGVRVVRPGEAPAEIEGDREAVAAARAAGGDFVIYGAFTRFGDGASLDLRCAQVVELADEEASPPSRRTFVHAGALAEIIPKLDTLSEKVVRYVLSGSGGSPRIAASAEAAAAPGNGQSALAAEVQELMRRVDALERAVHPPVATGEAAPAGKAAAGSGQTAVR
jgi:TolB-like protein